MIVTDFTVRRLARMVEARDLQGVGSLLLLMFEDHYHRVSTEEMLDTLLEVDRQVEEVMTGR